jgi:hypothetical protein
VQFVQFVPNPKKSVRFQDEETSPELLRDEALDGLRGLGGEAGKVGDVLGVPKKAARVEDESPFERTAEEALEILLCGGGSGSESGGPGGSAGLEPAASSAASFDTAPGSEPPATLRTVIVEDLGLQTFGDAVGSSLFPHSEDACEVRMRVLRHMQHVEQSCSVNAVLNHAVEDPSDTPDVVEAFLREKGEKKEEALSSSETLEADKLAADQSSTVALGDQKPGNGEMGTSVSLFVVGVVLVWEALKAVAGLLQRRCCKPKGRNREEPGRFLLVLCLS